MNIQQALHRKSPFFVNVYRYSGRTGSTPGAYLGIAHRGRDIADIASRSYGSQERELIYRLKVTPKYKGPLSRKVGT